ncbi:MAG: DNA repair protein RecN [Lachnospiraceae bacterium]|nr:DNA repair protein RecN [Lachnospiraceae bacterium]
MLESIHVKNLALIEESKIEFGKGLNILTGETGAGKSVLLTSVNLALGARADKDMIRAGSDEAYVSISFSKDQEAEALLDSWDIPIDDSIVISRKITAGKNVFKINGEIANARQVKALADILIDIHGQHEHQSLLNNVRQLSMLDEYGGSEVKSQISLVKEASESLNKVKRELDELTELSRGREREIGLLRYEIDEIENANLKAGEDDELEIKYRRMVESGKLIELLSEAQNLTGGDSEGSAGSLVSRAVQCVNKAKTYDESLESIGENLIQAEAFLGDFVIALSEYMSDLEFSEEEFNETEERLNLVNSLKSRFGNSIEEILSYRDEKAAELDKLEHISEYTENLSKEFAKLKADYEDKASKLTDIRKIVSTKFSKELIAELKELSFPNVVFEVKIEPDKTVVSSNGWDSCEFMISANPGEPVKPMKNVSSGGELSRIMLGIKTILAESDGIDSLIFDEIDAGISGRTAWAVSGELSRLSLKHQIIAITHLAQIAAMADEHYEISKSVSAGKTHTSILHLDKEGEIKEIARLIGTDEPGEATLINARELKDKANAEKSRRKQNK